MAKQPPRPVKPIRREPASSKPQASRRLTTKDVALLQVHLRPQQNPRAAAVTGVTVQQQREIAKAIKNAREMVAVLVDGPLRSTMKIILTQDVDNLGAPGDVVEVKTATATTSCLVVSPLRGPRAARSDRPDQARARRPRFADVSTLTRFVSNSKRWPNHLHGQGRRAGV